MRNPLFQFNLPVTSKYIVCLFAMLYALAAVVCAQHQFDNWYFGQNAGITFTGGAPVAVSGGQIVTNEGTASISDEITGTLLFYTDGVNVYDSSHTPMPNGDSLSGDVSCTQSALILRKPGSDSLYYIFTAPADGGLTDLCYSIVDMSLNGGHGDVSVKNSFMASGSDIAEKSTAIHHCNGTDWWVIFHELGSNVYRSWLLDATGLSASSVNSAAGTVITTDFNRGLGWMTSSADAAKIVLPSYSGGTVDLVEFNNGTGTMSNALQLTGFTKPYGTAFSPDGRFLYVTADMSLIQLDLSSGDSATISDSRFTVITELNMMRAMRPGPGGKIYVAREWDTYLGVIHNPGMAGTACNYSATGVDLSPGMNSLGLPNNYATAFTSCPVFAEDPSEPIFLETFPQPAILDLSFIIPSSTSGHAVLSILDPQGKQVHTYPILIKTGSHTETIYVSGLAPGFYIFHIHSADQFFSGRFIKM